MAPNSNAESTTNPNEDLQIPKWINEDYFQNILEKDVPNYVKIVKFTPIAATAPGENYTSVMVRVVMDVELKDGSTEHVSYILKTMLDNESASIINNMGLFPKEKQMYQVNIPKFTQLYKEAGIDIQMAPKCLHVEELPDRITLIMEDLKRKNFKNADRLKGLDMKHMRSVLHKLAEMHAASAVNFELNGHYDAIYHQSFFKEEMRGWFVKMATSRQVPLIKAMREWNMENVEHYIKAIPEPNTYFDQAMELNKSDPNEFNVLNHGDCWANNIMFSYKENGELDQTIFVDLQVGKWGSPAQDLWYFITTSASLDIKIKEFDHFIQIYHERLAECLKLLKYSKKIPSLKDIHISMLKYGTWGPYTANGVMVAVLLPSDKDANMENMLKEGPEADEFRYKTFINPYFVKAMCQLLPFFDNKGLLG